MKIKGENEENRLEYNKNNNTNDNNITSNTTNNTNNKIHANQDRFSMTNNLYRSFPLVHHENQVSNISKECIINKKYKNDNSGKDVEDIDIKDNNTYIRYDDYYNLL